MSSFLIRPSQGKKGSIVSSAQPQCQICGERESRYTCPHCNLHYCSLSCYKDAKHAACVDSFSQRTLEQDLAAEPARAPEQERERMLQLLQKLEQEELDSLNDGEGASGGLVDQLAGVNIDELKEEELLAVLTPEQRKAFDDMLKDPKRAQSFLQEAFESEQPWWLDAEDDDEDEGDKGTEDDEDSDDDSSYTRPIPKPQMLDGALLPPLKAGPDGKAAVKPELVYNVMAVLLAYAYCLRTFDLASIAALPPTSSERSLLQTELARLVPFLFEPSTLTLNDIGSAIAHVIARTGETIPHRFMAVLLEDVGAILAPSAITQVTEDASLTDHPSRIALLALSDIYKLLDSNVSSAAQKPKPSLINRPTSQKGQRGSLIAARKILFYASFLASPISPVPADRLRSITATLRAEARKYESEAQGIGERSDESGQARDLRVSTEPAALDDRPQAKIVELPSS